MGIKCRLIEPTGEILWFAVIKNGEHYDRIKIESYKDGDWDMLKEKFGEAFSGVSSQRVWNTENGDNNTPGDMYWTPWMHEGGKCMYWDNCNDPRGHLMVVMPNEDGYWDTDSRASNCTMKEDRNHRCWVKHGEAPNITVDKQGNTCQAGAGSIQMIHWHGYLRNGELVQ